MILIALAAIAFRLATLVVSVSNEKRLKAAGAVEFGAGNTRLLAIAHTVFYLAAIAEGVLRGSSFNGISAAGLAIYAFGAVALLLVLRDIGPQWTVKLIVSPGHRLVATGLYRHVRHPNYVLNILPELIGFALAMHGFATLLVGLPLYCIPLWRRVRQEEEAMREKFDAY